jgi:serine/threonine protein kinase
VVARFEAERQALALMDHPTIAKVFDGGPMENGRLYFVMELVRGVPITRYCDENQLSTGARLELFLQVCEAVQHAHQKGVIHRDLKPCRFLRVAGAPLDNNITERLLKTSILHRKSNLHYRIRRGAKVGDRERKGLEWYLFIIITHSNGNIENERTSNPAAWRGH